MPIQLSGRAEKSNKRLNGALRAAIPEGKENQWDLYLSYATFALNSLSNCHTGFSAHRVVFGRELNTPLSILVQNEDHFESVPVTSKNAEVYELYKRMKSISLQVRKNADTDFMYAKNFHDRNLHGPYFKAGDLCYVLIDCPSHKFAPRWRGPFIIKEAINDHIYRVNLQQGQDKIINISKLKHYKVNKFSFVPIAGSSTLDTSVEIPLTSQSPKPGASHNTEYDDDDQFVTLPYDTRDTHGTRTPPIPLSTPPSPAPIHQSYPTLSAPSTASGDESPEIDHSLSAEIFSWMRSKMKSDLSAWKTALLLRPGPHQFTITRTFHPDLMQGFSVQDR